MTSLDTAAKEHLEYSSYRSCSLLSWRNFSTWEAHHCSFLEVKFWMLPFSRIESFFVHASLKNIVEYV